MEYFYFDKHELDRIARESHDSYVSATPFPHIVLDRIIPNEVLDAVFHEFPSPQGIDWKSFSDDARQNRKLSCEDESQIGPITRHVLSQFNSGVFLTFLEQLTGIQNLIGDPHFRGGGLHQTLRGGSLGMHADFNYYKRLKLYRRINLILYVNPKWEESYGGHLELWNKEMTRCEKRVLPVFNRAVIFNTDNFSNHGQPEPLQCPENESRKSLALYYYTVDSPSGSKEGAHTTLFRRRPGKDDGFRAYETSFVKKIARNIRKIFS